MNNKMDPVLLIEEQLVSPMDTIEDHLVIHQSLISKGPILDQEANLEITDHLRRIDGAMIELMKSPIHTNLVKTQIIEEAEEDQIIEEEGPLIIRVSLN